ncbi:MAG: MBOAT family protein [Deltaproteobacteria bacterium]|nr:MBOAT family protein [Deltaproteobacteria bacterium]
MLFNSLDYLLFLLLVVGVYWALLRYRALRFAIIFLASCVFYMAWNPAYIILIFFSICVDYIAGRAIFTAGSPRVKKNWLIASVACNLGLLGTFKYFNFFCSATNDIFSLFGFDIPVPYLDVLLPVGISFYTFQSLSYTIDIYRGRLEPTRNFVKFSIFITFFPQLVAGPIVRAVQFLPQLTGPPRLNKEKVGEGLFLIATGLFKKVAIADFLAVNLVDRVFDDPTGYSSLEVLIALYCYTMQMYCDFSGYTDVARGSAMFFGLELPENFNRPYQSTNPAEFWRRWHITLSSWLRDYLYYPLGGSRVKPARAYWNLWFTVFIVGLWHGASWNFVLYGILHASAMAAHRYFYRRAGRTRETVDPTALRISKTAAMFHFTVLSRILFRSTDLPNAVDVGGQLLSGSAFLFHIAPSIWTVLILSYVSHYLPRSWYEQSKRLFVRSPAPLQGIALSGLAILLAAVASRQVVPYIYFQF